MSEKDTTDSVQTIPLEIEESSSPSTKLLGPCYLGIQMKYGYTLKNLLAIPLSVVIASIASSYINT